MFRFLSRYSGLRNLGIITAETLALIACTLAGFRIRFIYGNESTWGGQHLLLKAVAIAFVFQVVNHLLDLYEFTGTRLHAIVRRLIAVACSSAFLITVSLLSPGLLVPRGALLITLILAFTFYVLWHLLLGVYIDRGPRTNVLVIGTNQLAQDVTREILRRPEVRMRVAGFLGIDPKQVGTKLVNPGVVGTTADVGRLVAEMDVRKVIVTLTDRRGVLPIGDLLDLKCRGVTVEEGTSVYERVTGKVALDNLKPSWLIFNPGFEVSRATSLVKDIFSFSVASIFLVLASPLMLLTALAIKLDSRGPVFFKQERVGLNGRVFKLWKFRSMPVDAEKGTGPVWASEHDSRATRVGRVIRKTRIDELPQLFNVLGGDMHFVGPRPERPVFVEQLLEKIPYYGLRHIVKPGITGWAQINYGYGRSEEDTVEKLQYDLFYIKNLSVFLDVVILLETVKAVLRGKGV